MVRQRTDTGKDLEASIARFRQELSFRAVIGALTLFFCLIIHYSGLVNLPIVGLTLLCFFVMLVNIPYSFLLSRTRSPFPLVTVFCITDALVITCLIHFTGGVANSILVLAYPLLMIYAGLNLSLRSTYILAISSIFFYWTLWWMERSSVFSSYSQSLSLSVDYTLGKVCAAGALLMITALFAANFSVRLKRKNQILEESEGRYRLLAENISDFVWTADENLRYGYVSPSVERLLGFTVEEMLGKELRAYLTPESWKESARDLRDETDDPQGEYDDPFRDRTLELEHRRRDGSTVWTEVKISHLRKPEGGMGSILGVSRDITERKRLEEQLHQSQKLEAIGRLAGGISHDFNNVLTAIIGYSDIIQLRLGRENPVHRELSAIKQSGQRAASLTRQLLSFSRNQVIQPRVLDLDTILQDMESMLKPLIGEDIALTIDSPPGFHTVKADKGQIEQVIMNLAVNARDALGRGGKIIISTESLTMKEEDLSVFNGSRPGPFVCLSVEDTGIGMDQQTLARIFEPFYTTKDSGSGTGLGLSVVYGIVKKHDGWIDVQSRPGQGTSFRVFLPAHEGAVSVVAENRLSLHTLQGRGERVLVVEDEQNIRELVKRTLQENGYVIFDAASSAEALDIFGKENGDFQLVFSDVVLPDQNGIELVEQLLRRNPGLSILLSSGYTDEKSQWSCICEKGFSYLQKPYTLRGLLRTVRETISERQGVQSAA